MDDARLFLCARCPGAHLLALRSWAASLQRARGESRRAAGRRYQQSRRGRHCHAERQRRYRCRRREGALTHHGSVFYAELARHCDARVTCTAIFYAKYSLALARSVPSISRKPLRRAASMPIFPPPHVPSMCASCDHQRAAGALARLCEHVDGFRTRALGDEVFERVERELHEPRRRTSLRRGCSTPTERGRMSSRESTSTC